MALVNHVFAWVVPLVYVYFTYGKILQTKAGSITFFGFIGLSVEEGFGMNKEFAREFRFLIPIFLAVAVLSVLKSNVAGIYDVITFALHSNIAAVPFRLLSYRLSDRYLNDVAPKRAVELLQ